MAASAFATYQKQLMRTIPTLLLALHWPCHCQTQHMQVPVQVSTHASDVTANHCVARIWRLQRRFKKRTVTLVAGEEEEEEEENFLRQYSQQRPMRTNLS